MKFYNSAHKENYLLLLACILPYVLTNLRFHFRLGLFSFLDVGPTSLFLDNALCLIPGLIFIGFVIPSRPNFLIFSLASVLVLFSFPVMKS